MLCSLKITCSKEIGMVILNVPFVAMMRASHIFSIARAGPGSGNGFLMGRSFIQLVLQLFAGPFGKQEIELALRTGSLGLFVTHVL